MQASRLHPCLQARRLRRKTLANFGAPQEIAPLAHLGIGRRIAHGQIEHRLGRGRLADLTQDARHGIAAPKRLPPRRQTLGRLAAPRGPIDLLTHGQQPGNHVAEPIQAEPRHQRQGRLVAIGQPIAQHVVGQLEQQRARLGAVEHAEPRVDARLHGVGPQQRRTKRMDRADPRRVQIADQLQPIARLVLGTFQQAATAGGADAVAHFAGGPLGKRDGHQLAQTRAARGPVRLQFVQEPLGQHERLAAAGAGRERNRRAARADGPLLLVGQARLRWAGS